MKKTLVSALTTALVVGAASTTFAAANPFSDVPADHWAYDAVSQLAADGVINGYGDGTYRGERNITRYEMAQMIAKAMAKQDVSAANKALIDKLAAEFRDELNNLGVRVANLEKHADMVQWTGKLEYTYESERLGGNRGSAQRKDNKDKLKFRLEPKAEVNDHWTVHARLDADTNMKHDRGEDGNSNATVRLKRAWAQGDYNNFQVKFGKMKLYTNEKGLLFDDEYSGAEVTFGNKLKVTLMGGRIKDDVVAASRGAYFNRLTDSKATWNDGVGNDPSSMWGINLQYDNGKKGFYGGLGYYNIKDSDFKTANIIGSAGVPTSQTSAAVSDGFVSGTTTVAQPLYSKDNKEDKASIWSINAGYRFGKADFWATYARNGRADYENNAWQIELDYGTYDHAKDKGSWGVYAAYRQLGANTSFKGTYDGAMRGTKGWEIGAQYAPFKNIGVLVKYFHGKTISGNYDARKLFGRVEFFF